MTVKSAAERTKLIEAGKRLGLVLSELEKAVRPGVSTETLDDLAEKLIRDAGDEPCFLGYTPEGADRPYPATLCVSVNDEIVHGIPNESPRTLSEGDIVGLDLGLSHEGFIVDSAITVAVGKTDKAARALMDTTRDALRLGIAAARPGNRVGDISHAIETAFKGSGFSIVKQLGGHGVGAAVHEEPFIPNFGRAGTGPLLKEGMVLALEPIANEGKAAVAVAGDGYTYRTRDGSRSAHFEHTILIEKDETLILTRRPGETES
ncbi:MAG: type I methionyl aminopeptidase [Patescibacteria group bacterium]|nr:type I methionyl aminopeptidase [Patescibacteria group bacterium]MDE1966332.1 type I methionyl aminopeptidase [Patescibacteria group bacterium]